MNKPWMDNRPWISSDELRETFLSGFSAGDLLRFRVVERVYSYSSDYAWTNSSRLFYPGECVLAFELDVAISNKHGEVCQSNQVGLQSHFGGSVSVRFLFEGTEYEFGSPNPLSFTFRNQMKVKQK